MNSFKIKLVTLLLCCAGVMNAQQKEETIKKQITLSGDVSEYTLHALNINGPIEVSGYDGNTITIAVKKIIKANSNDEVEKGMKEFTFMVSQKGDQILVRPEAPFIQYNDDGEGGFQMNGCGNKYGPKYDFYGEYEIKIPRNMMVKVSTINRGDILVSNVQTDVLEVNNINGAITLDKVSGQSTIGTINGNIDVVYVKNPRAKSSYSTINGKITLHCLKNLGANVSFESMHGDFYTDFDVTSVRSNTTKTKNKKRNNVAFVIKSKPLMTIGKGGTLYDFKTLNGDVYIKKI